MGGRLKDNVRIGYIERFRLSRRISLNKIEPAYKEAIGRFGRELSEDERAELLEDMKVRTYFSKWSKMLKCDLPLMATGGVVMAAGTAPGSNAAGAEIFGGAILGYGLWQLGKSIISFRHSCYFPKPVHRISLKYPNSDMAFHEAVHFMHGEGLMSEDCESETIAVAASALYSGDGDEYLKSLLEDVKSGMLTSRAMSGRYMRGISLARQMLEVKGSFGADAAWDQLYAASQTAIY